MTRSYSPNCKGKVALLLTYYLLLSSFAKLHTTNIERNTNCLQVCEHRTKCWKKLYKLSVSLWTQNQINLMQNKHIDCKYIKGADCEISFSQYCLWIYSFGNVQTPVEKKPVSPSQCFYVARVRVRHTCTHARTHTHTHTSWQTVWWI